MAWATGRSERVRITGRESDRGRVASAAFRCARSSVARCSACLRFCAQVSGGVGCLRGGITRGHTVFLFGAAKNKVGICASPRERGTKHRGRARDGADARGVRPGPGQVRPTIRGPRSMDITIDPLRGDGAAPSPRPRVAREHASAFSLFSGTRVSPQKAVLPEAGSGGRPRRGPASIARGAHLCVSSVVGHPLERSPLRSLPAPWSLCWASRACSIHATTPYRARASLGINGIMPRASFESREGGFCPLRCERRALTPDGVDPSAAAGDVRSARSLGAPEIDPGIERRWDRV